MRNKKSLLLALIILIFPGSFIVISHCGNPKSKVDPLKFYSVDNPGAGADTVSRTIGDFSFTNQYGEKVTADNYKGSIWVANVFFSTCIATCPRITNSIQQLQSKFKNDPSVRFLSITVDPETDSVARIKVYADSVGAMKDKWNFATGEKKYLYSVAMSQFLFKALKSDDGAVKFIHDNSLRLIDKEGRLRGESYEPLTRGGVEKLIDDIERLRYEYKTSK